jgi:uncharacterized alpha-E superfamily protein
MLSRVADSLYWVGRYAERTETNTHILAMQLESMLEYSQLDGKYRNDWQNIVRICGYFDDYNSRYHTLNKEDLIYYLLNDIVNYNAINILLGKIRENAKNARDIIPNELWEVWNELYLQMPQYEQYDNSLLNTMDQLMQIRRACLTATGVIDSLMTRDEGFLFLKIGKWLERSEKTALTIYHLMQHNEKTLEKEFAISLGLKLTNVQEEFTRRTRKRDSDQILNFLMGDLKCTRSVAYGMKKIKTTIYDIENGKQQIYATQLFLAIEEIEQLVQIDASTLSYEERIQWVDSIRTKCTELGPIFSRTYYLTPPILVGDEAYEKLTF